jgi:hypothetical protein
VYTAGVVLYAGAIVQHAGAIVLDRFTVRGRYFAQFSLVATENGNPIHRQGYGGILKNSCEGGQYELYQGLLLVRGGPLKAPTELGFRP